MIFSFIAGFGVAFVLSILFYKDVANDVLKVRTFLHDAKIRLESAYHKDEKILRAEVSLLSAEIKKIL